MVTDLALCTVGSAEATTVKKPYYRYHYRVPVDCPVMFAEVPLIGEGRLRNLTVTGCSIDGVPAIQPNGHLELRLFLPDQAASCPISLAKVRWISGTQAGLEFIRVPQNSQTRLHHFVLTEFAKAVQARRDQSAAPTLDLR